MISNVALTQKLGFGTNVSLSGEAPTMLYQHPKRAEAKAAIDGLRANEWNDSLNISYCSTGQAVAGIAPKKDSVDVSYTNENGKRTRFWIGLGDSDTREERKILKSFLKDPAEGIRKLYELGQKKLQGKLSKEQSKQSAQLSAEEVKAAAKEFFA